MRWLLAACFCWATGAGCVIAFFVGRGKLINEWRDYCADYAQQQQRASHHPTEYLHSQRMWDELERVEKEAQS